LRKTLHELKIGTSNEEGSNIVVLQNEEVLVSLKSIDGHAMRNVLKRRQSLGINSPTTLFTSNFIPRYALPSIPTSISMDTYLPLVGFVVDSSPSSTSTLAPTNKGRTKGEYL
jgi:hypothetical protein